MTDTNAWTDAEGARHARQLFDEAFEAAASGVTAAPGRVNLIGEHTDYNGGPSLPIALPHRTFVAWSPRPDQRVRMISSEAREIRDIGAIGPKGCADEVAGWAAYPAGVLWAMRQSTGQPLTGMDIAVASCVPTGAGLSSSAALECAIALAVAEANGLAEDRGGWVRDCIRAENEIAGAPTGGMDQAAALLTRQGHALLHGADGDQHRHVPFTPQDDAVTLLVIDTRTRHEHSTGEYAARRTTCEEAANRLNVGVLGDLTGWARAVEARLDPVSARRVRHVVTEIARTHEVARLLATRSPDWSRIGALFTASHHSLRDDYAVSCPELDLVVDTALSAGALGARMTGGGFGGCALVLAPATSVAEVTAEVRDVAAAHDFAEPEVFAAVASAAASSITT